MRTSEQATALSRVLLERIRERGRISFAEFMQACLYHPQHGYYTRALAAGADDYYTSPQVNPFSAD